MECSQREHAAESAGRATRKHAKIVRRSREECPCLIRRLLLDFTSIMAKPPPTARQNRHSQPEGHASLYDEGDLPGLLEGKQNPLVLVLDCVQDPHNL